MSSAEVSGEGVTYQGKSGAAFECLSVFSDTEGIFREEGGETEAGEGTVHGYLLEKAQASLLHSSVGARVTWPETAEGFPDDH